MKKIVCFLLVLLLFSGCGGRLSKKQALDQTLYKYAKMMRWGNYQAAFGFLSPDIDKSKKPSRLDIDRLSQFNISSYVAAPILPGEKDNEVIQDVELKLYNKHSKRERVVIDRQVWEYDEEQGNWWLTSGLPKLTH